MPQSCEINLCFIETDNSLYHKALKLKDTKQWNRFCENLVTFSRGYPKTQGHTPSEILPYKHREVIIELLGDMDVGNLSFDAPIKAFNTLTIQSTQSNVSKSNPSRSFISDVSNVSRSPSTSQASNRTSLNDASKKDALTGLESLKIKHNKTLMDGLVTSISERKQEGGIDEFGEDINALLVSYPVDFEPYSSSLMPTTATLEQLEDRFLNPQNNKSADFWFRRIFLFYQQSIYKKTKRAPFIARMRDAYIKGDAETKLLILTQLEQWIRCYYRDLSKAHENGELNVFTVQLSETKQHGIETKDSEATDSDPSSDSQSDNEQEKFMDKLAEIQNSVKELLDQGKMKLPIQMQEREEHKNRRHHIGDISAFGECKEPEIKKEIKITPKMQRVLDRATSENHDICQFDVREKGIKGPKKGANCAQMFAEALCIIDREAFLTLEIREFANKEWTRKDTRDFEAFHILDTIDIFNKRSIWVTSQILAREKIKERAKCLEIFIQCAYQCVQLSNWYAGFAIFNAVSHSVIQRLKKTWEILEEKSTVNAQMKYLKTFLNSIGQYKTYRKQFSKNLKKLQRQMKNDAAFATSVMIPSPSGSPRSGSDSRCLSIVDSPVGSPINRSRALSSTGYHTPRRKTLSSTGYNTPPPTYRTASPIFFQHIDGKRSTPRSRAKRSASDTERGSLKTPPVSRKILAGRSTRFVSAQIPHLVVLLTDLFRLEELPSMVDPESETVNFHKYAKGWKVLFVYLLQCQHCLRVQMPKEPAKMINKLKEIYSQTLEDVFGEEEMWKMSYRLEPKNVNN